jgi:hypothetical protein
MNFSQYLRWDYLAMFLAMGILFTLEMLGIFGRHYVTITAIVRAFLPAWARAMILGWLCFHFLIQSPK